LEQPLHAVEYTIWNLERFGIVELVMAQTFELCGVNFFTGGGSDLMLLTSLNYLHIEIQTLVLLSISIHCAAT
jgi:hypothetical protein